MENVIKHIKGTGRERVYNFIVEFIKNNGYAPSVREICAGTDLSSTSSVYAHLLKLEDEGKIEMKKEIYQSNKGDWFSVREDGGIGIMGIFRLKVVQRGTIIVDGVDSLEEAEEYIESCNPVDDVKWSGFLEAMQGGIELQKISIPEFMLVMDFADRILVRPAEIIKWLFLRGKVKQLDSEIGFDDMKEFADGYGFICEKEGISNKRMIDIEKEINDFFASDEFKKLSLSYDGVYRDYCNSEKFQIFDDTSIEPICRGVNEKIREIIDNAAINMFIRNNGIYMESDFSFGRKRDIQIGRLIITECGFGGRKDNWIFRFDNEYAYYTFQVHDGEVIRHYRILDVKEKISDV